MEMNRPPLRDSRAEVITMAEGGNGFPGVCSGRWGRPLHAPRLCVSSDAGPVTAEFNAFREYVVRNGMYLLVHAIRNVLSWATVSSALKEMVP